jgi:hypothetical protein
VRIHRALEFDDRYRRSRIELCPSPPHPRIVSDRRPRRRPRARARGAGGTRSRTCQTSFFPEPVR